MRGMLVVAFLGVALLVISGIGWAREIPEWDIEGLRSQGVKEGWTFDVGESWVTDYLKSGGDIRHITGAVRPIGWRLRAKFVDIVPDRDLPAAFDWRDEVPGGLQAIRNQGSCGSCWAFSVTAVTEALYLIAHPSHPIDLAEQTLVSGCFPSGSCSGGYFDAFNYIKSPGLPDETQDPYQAQNTRCRSGLKPTVHLLSWAYIGDGRSEPTTEQMKTAIKKYGPISVTVNGSFGSYAGGIYNRCNSGSINHMVTIEGWNDDGQYWIMRNSWGADWGEQGYMKIKYTGSSGHKCNNIGETAAFAVVDADPIPTPTPNPPFNP